MTVKGREKISTGRKSRVDHVMTAEKGKMGKALKRNLLAKGIEAQGLGKTLIGKAKGKREEGEAPATIVLVIGIGVEIETALIQTEVGEATTGITKEEIIIAVTIDTMEIEVLIEMAQIELSLFQVMIDTITGAKKDRTGLMKGPAENMGGTGITGDMERKGTKTTDSSS